MKFAIMSDEELLKQTIHDVKNGILQKEDYIHYFSSIESFRSIFTNERMRVLSTIRREKPDSIYALAKLLGRDFKSVLKDVKLLEGFRLLTLDSYKVGMRVKIRPKVKARVISMSLAL